MSDKELRDARALLEQLDRAIPPHTYSVAEASSDGDPLLEAARRLALGPRVELIPAARERIEARLHAHIAAAPLRAQTLYPVPRWRPGLALRAAVAVLLTLVVALAGLTSASASSLPGDDLYPLKRAVEGARLALVSQTSEPGLRVELAERRLDEFASLLDRHDVYPSALEDASAELDRALDLLAGGHGERAQLDPRIATLTRQQTALIARAAPLASVETLPRLSRARLHNHALQQRLANEGGVPGLVPERTPTPTPTATATPTPTSMPTGTLIGIPGGLTGAPTRTPPGHGATPGLGDNPPGHGGPNPGIGNDGQPPGLIKPK